MRSNILQKCNSPVFSYMPECNNATMSSEIDKLAMDYHHFDTYHHGLYLGFEGLHPFNEKRLMVSMMEQTGVSMHRYQTLPVFMFGGAVCWCVHMLLALSSQLMLVICVLLQPVLFHLPVRWVSPCMSHDCLRLQPYPHACHSNLCSTTGRMSPSQKLISWGLSSLLKTLCMSTSLCGL